MSEQFHPQNPYHSCVLSASAGSGKTYQLCRRFLHLVAAGSDPGKIVTVTFTVKAAREMRSRILAEASALRDEPKAQREFIQASQEFYRWGQQFWQEQGIESLRPPLGPKEVAAKILSASQQLKITTTDSLFKDWVEQFPFESGLYAQEENLGSAPWSQELSLAEPWQEEEFHQEAWTRLFSKKNLRREVLACWQEIARHEPEVGILDLAPRMMELYRYHTFIWQLQGGRGEQEDAHEQGFIPHPLYLDEAEGSASLGSVLHARALEFSRIIRGTTKEAAYGEAIAAGDIGRLQQEGLLTRSYEVSKVVLRGKKRDERSDDIFVVEEQLRRRLEHQQLVRLNGIGCAMFRLYTLWYGERLRCKQEQGKIEFCDLAMGSFRLLRGEDAHAHAQWQIQRRITHLLIDEMQDTSVLQWGIFSGLLEELLAGSNEEAQQQGLISTAFVVGDKKQSIYGFREADPSLLERAGNLFSRQGWPLIPLSSSYRTAQTLLDFINRVFTEHFDPEFPLHSTACDGKGTPVVPDLGEVFCFDTAEGDAGENSENKDDEEVGPAQKEAQYIAGFIARHCLEDTAPLEIYDKERGGLRRLELGDCCIVYRSSTHVAVLEAELAAQKIPYRREEQRNYFSQREIADMLALLQYLWMPEDLIALLTVLRSPLAGLSDSIVLGFLSSLEGEVTTAQLRGMVAKEHPELDAVLANLEALAVSVLPHELLWEAYERIGVLGVYRQASPGLAGENAARNLLQLLEIAIAVEQGGHRQLGEFLQELVRLQERDSHGCASSGEGVVTLMTIHKAKGLEFPLVAVMGLGDEWSKLDPYWLKSDTGMIYVGRREQQPRSEDNPLAVAQQLQRERLYAEAVRVLYVALTRAKHYLVLVGSSKKRTRGQSFLSLIQQTLDSPA